MTEGGNPEIEEACKSFRLPRATLFLESLRKKDILEVFTFRYIACR